MESGKCMEVIRNDVIMAMGNIMATVWMAEKKIHIKQAFQLGHDLRSSEIQTIYIASYLHRASTLLRQYFITPN